MWRSNRMPSRWVLFTCPCRLLIIFLLPFFLTFWLCISGYPNPELTEWWICIPPICYGGSQCRAVKYLVTALEEEIPFTHLNGLQCLIFRPQHHKHELVTDLTPCMVFLWVLFSVLSECLELRHLALSCLSTDWFSLLNWLLHTQWITVYTSDN